MYISFLMYADDYLLIHAPYFAINQTKCWWLAMNLGMYNSRKR